MDAAATYTHIHARTNESERERERWTELKRYPSSNTRTTTPTYSRIVLPYPLVLDGILCLCYDLLHILDGHDLVHLLQALVACLQSLHHLHPNLDKLNVLHHLLKVVHLLVSLVQQ